MSKSDKGSKREAEDAPTNKEFKRAMNRLDAAVRDLGDVAKDGFAERAAEFLEDTAARLKSDFSATGRRAYSGGSDEAAEADGAGHGGYDQDVRNRTRGWWGYGYGRRDRVGYWRGAGSVRPFRDLDNKRCAGVCAGMAPYLGLEPWVVRCIAITGFVFMPQVVLPAYIVGYFVLDPVGGSDKPRRQRRMERKRRRSARKTARSQSRANRRTETPVAPRSSLRSVQTTLDEAEQRLRMMEGHVTSDRYELQRELRKIEE